MTATRWIVVVILVSVLSAVVLALVSRAPEDVREAKAGDEALDPSLGARFTDEQIARHGAFRGPGYLAFGLGALVEIVTLVALARGIFGELFDLVRRIPGGWPVHAVVAGAAVATILTIAALPLGYVRGYANAHAWGLSTQDVGGWLSDRSRALLVSAVVAAVSAVAFFAVVRWQPRFWWLVGWIAFTLLTAAITFLYPVVIAPLFNKFTPLEDRALAADVRALARDVGITVDEVLVADASKRTTAENAYVAGIGATKQVVIYDTLLASGSDADVRFVVAHELGHRKENHVAKNIVVASAGLLIGFLVLAWLIERTGFLTWAGATGLSDIRALPALLLFAVVAGLVVLPVESYVSRRFEARADAIAFELTDEPAAAVRAFRRLAFSNIADLRPPDLAVGTLFSHPPIPDRIRAALDS